ncbi:MAG: hypothetical protein C4536_13775 [Actinobacteria bacterium]|nr:MAG: hypothetical protein C4536_13775 [Actinomycetota bacterium]
MHCISISGPGKALASCAIILLLLSLLLASPWPLSTPAGADDVSGRLPAPVSGGDLYEELGISRPYFAPDAAGIRADGGGDALASITQGVPAELLPESLLPEGESAPRAAEGDFEAAGTGGWTPLTRPYLPSGAANVSYWVSSSSQLLDDSGRMHAVYGRAVNTNIGQPPDAPGYTTRDLQDLLYCTFSEGAWNVPGSITGVTGLGDSDLVYFNTDDGGYTHIIYSKWVWGRDASRPAATLAAYQHEEENLWYRYIAPDGTWSAPRQLTGFTGSWAMLGADFTMQGNRLCGALTMRRNNETTPSSFLAYQGFVEGYLDGWEPVVQLAAWNYNNDPGQLQPDFWPSLDVSDLGGEITVAYAVRTQPGALYTGKLDVYGCVRDAGGAWSGPGSIAHAANNEEWLPIFVFYRPGANTASVFCVRFVQVQDATHPPRDDLFIVHHRGGAWEAPVNVTRVAAQQDGTYFDLALDTFGDLHFCYMVIRFSWVGGSWQTQGGELKYTRETAVGMSAPATILPYLPQRYFGENELALDSDDNVHLLFSTFMFDGVNFWDYNVGYSTNAPGGNPGTFPPATLLRPSTAYNIYDLTLSAFPDGDVLASWFEKGFDGGGNPNYSRMYSRYRDGTTWGSTLLVSSIPGNTDMLHVIQGSWPNYADVTVGASGEQQAVFETAKYHFPTATWYDFRKYFTETVNGVWTTPQLISSDGVSGDKPSLYVDGGQRYFVLYSVLDAATGKDVLYATQQRDPTPPAATYFFAEGTTRSGFDEWLCLQNSGEQQANATITYMLESGANIDQAVPVPAHSRVTVNVNAVVGPEHDVSARVSADQFIACERPMYFDYHGWTGGHCVMGARDTSRLWYFAEGTTRSGFDEYLTLQNPSGEEAHVAITYVLGDGTTMPGDINIGPRSRATVNVNTAIGPDRDVSMVVESDTAIVCERPMYFDYRGMTGGHCEVGSTSLANRWYFAEGTTRSGFDTYICLQNPHTIDAVASLTFILGDGSTVVQPMLVPATSRQTLRVNDAIGPDHDVSTVVDSNSLLLAERPMYFDYRGAWPGGHVAAGARTPKNAWFFAEGTTREGFEEWICLQNPGDVDATATLSMMLDGGTVQGADVAVPAHTRVTVAMPNLVEPGRDVSVVVECDRAIVAERPMYFLYHNAWPGGHVVVGL